MSRAAPECRSRGRLLTDLDSHQCRFPIVGEGVGARFCAVEIAVGEWLPGFPMGSYCQFHRTVVVRAAAPEAASSGRGL
jgi:hypothetical protein